MKYQRKGWVKVIQTEKFKHIKLNQVGHCTLAMSTSYKKGIVENVRLKDSISNRKKNGAVEC